MMRKFLLLVSVVFAYLTISAQDLAITSPTEVPDPVAFCMGESITMEVSNLGEFASISSWYKCDEEPDLTGYSNYSKWEAILDNGSNSTYTFNLEGPAYYWVQVYEFGNKMSNVIFIDTKGTVPTMIYTEADTAFCEGSTVVVSATPADLGDGNFKWFKDGVEIAAETTADYTISEAGLFHVEAKDPNGDCPDNFIPSAAVEFSLIKPAIYGDLKLDLNRMSFSTNDVYTSYQWYSGADAESLAIIDGATEVTYNATISATDTYYAVEVVTGGACTAMSEAKLVNNILYSTPVIVEPAETFACRDGSIELTVENDVYATYQWYKDGNSIYNATTASITVDKGYNYGTGSYSVKVTTVLDETDELESAAIELEIAEQAKIYVLDNATFCPGAEVTLYTDDKFDTYQWLVNDSYDVSTAVEIANATDTSVIITIGEETRYYFVRTTYNACEDASNGKYVKAYSLNAPNIYTSTYEYEGKMCMGDSVALKGGGYDVTWQWYLNGEAVEGMTEKDPYAKAVGSYTLEITSIQCPEMDPVMSNNAVEVKYAVAPTFTYSPETVLWNDDPNHPIFCAYDTITLSVENAENYSTWQWMGKLFSPSSTSDDWEDIEDQNASDYTFINGVENNKMHFKVRVDSLMDDGTYCIGISEYKTIDQWAFASPAITSFNNTELCEEGDSTLMCESFPSTAIKYEWYLDGELIPDSDNDSIWGKELGEYTMTIYPAECPNIGMSTGMGPVVSFMPDAEIWENDTCVYAMPEVGFYNFQWYYSETDPNYGSSDYYIENMTAVEMDTLTVPWIIPFYKMKPGYYAVDVNNPGAENWAEKCVRTSDLYAYQVTTGVEDMVSKSVKIYPNPVNNILSIQIPETDKVQSVAIYNVAGVMVENIVEISNRLDIPVMEKENGIYIVKVKYYNSNSEAYRIVKN